MPYEIELISIRCQDSQQSKDKPYLRVNNHVEWGPIEMRTGNTRTINLHVPFDHDVRIELWESDRRSVPHRKDDHFGTMHLNEREVIGLIRGDRNLLTHTFQRDRGIVGDVYYTLTYDLHSI
jgi:hypothetical protein